MTLPRGAPRSARFAADCLLVALVAIALVLLALLYPNAPERPRWPPQDERAGLAKIHR